MPLVQAAQPSVNNHVADPTGLGDTLIQADNVGVLAGGKWLIKQISFTLARGQLVSIIGPNGGGKSTLVKAVAGLVPISRGNIVKNQELSLGLVPQNFKLPASLPLRVIDYLYCKSEISHLPTNIFTTKQSKSNRQIKHLFKKSRFDHTASQFLDYIIEQLGLVPLLTKQMHELSGGERQRVLLANALINKPDVLLLDEPMQGVDMASAEMLYALVRELPDRLNCAVLMVSHDLHWVMAGTNHVLCINQHLCCQGSPRSVQSSPEFQSLFAQPLAFYEHHHHCEHEHDCDTHTNTTSQVYE